MPKLCRICKRNANVASDYCEAHRIAESNLVAAYDAWTKAFDGVSMKDFLEEISRLPETGEKSKEMAKHLLKGRFA